MARFLLGRFLQLIPTFIGATFLAFMIIQLAPGDFLTQRSLDPNIRPETIERLRSQFGLDQPFVVQYFLFMGNLLQGDLGYSFAYQQPVWNVVIPRMLNSLILVGLSLVFLFALAIPIGVVSALRPYSWVDQILSFFSYVGLAIPNFFLALILIYLLLEFNFWAGFLPFPVGGMTSRGYDDFSTAQQFLDVLWHALIPALIVATADIAGYSRVLRGQMLEVLDQDYIRTARAKGLAERAVVYKHALRNAVVFFVAGVGGLLPALVGGAGFVEVVMNWPGITPLYLEALSQQDLFVLTGFLTITLVLLMIGNLLSDLLLAAVDPRIRYG